jgi:hypothetical protein
MSLARSGVRLSLSAVGISYQVSSGRGREEEGGRPKMQTHVCINVPTLLI